MHQSARLEPRLSRGFISTLSFIALSELHAAGKRIIRPSLSNFANGTSQFSPASQSAKCSAHFKHGTLIISGQLSLIEPRAAESSRVTPSFRRLIFGRDSREPRMRHSRNSRYGGISGSPMASPVLRLFCYSKSMRRNYAALRQASVCVYTRGGASLITLPD